MENISTYRGETQVISVAIPQGYSTYTTSFTINDNQYFDGTNSISITGVSIVNNVSTITITPTLNILPVGVYYYQVDISNGINMYIIATGSYTVLPSLTS